ncbi:MAG TPA: helix-turn-helix domain-containing protein [Candidatus Enterocloster faecavium]|uniref:Helix-turn-helix domain-containing protein n=1 Tax=Candidatus Enterocloster faecavium TaxID=2838560 RepID=A0A9D2RKD3_9FIRM|nr:helix-turn-helix domain-containing protein [Candidatus Enterocloster faecavium]
MTQGERIKEIRKYLDLTMEKFGERLGVGKTAISKLENNERNLTDQMAVSICREFDVNETWLRTGEGEMFIQRTRNQQITDFLGDLIKEEDGTFKKRLIEAMSKLDKKDWEDIERLVNKLAKKD